MLVWFSVIIFGTKKNLSVFILFFSVMNILGVTPEHSNPKTRWSIGSVLVFLYLRPLGYVYLLSNRVPVSTSHQNLRDPFILEQNKTQIEHTFSLIVETHMLNCDPPAAQCRTSAPKLRGCFLLAGTNPSTLVVPRMLLFILTLFNHLWSRSCDAIWGHSITVSGFSCSSFCCHHVGWLVCPQTVWRSRSSDMSPISCSGWGSADR